MTKKLMSLRILLFSLVSIFGVTACVYGPYYVGTPKRWPHNYHYPYKYDYYFYPSLDVYFRYSTGDYFFRLDNHWRHSKTLPPRIFLDPRDRVIIRERVDRPYEKFKEHRGNYKPYPKYQRDQKLDRKEREYHSQSHKEYLKRNRESDFRRNH